MPVTDPIADMITRIRNAYLANLGKVKIPHSRIKEAIAMILKNEGYINELKIEKAKPQSQIAITL